jgi:hypothetical protein
MESLGTGLGVHSPIATCTHRHRGRPRLLDGLPLWLLAGRIDVTGPIWS